MLLTDLSLYPANKKIIEACEQVARQIDSIKEFEQYWYDVAKNETVPDYDGNDVCGREDVKLSYMPIYGGSVSNFVEAKFKSVIDLLINMAGVSKASIVFIGPNSLVPRHIDDDKIPAYTNSNCFNVFTGVAVPNNATIIVDGEAVVHAKHKAIIFDAQQPHSAKNESNDWWISLLIYIEKDKFNL